MKKFLENYWFGIMMTLLFAAMMFALIGASNKTRSDKQICLERGMVYVTLSGAGSYCAPIETLEKI